MSDLNLFAISGRLMADPTFSETENTEVCHFTLVSNEFIGGEERPAFIPITVFGRDAKLCQEYLLKGHGAIVHGRVETSLYQTKEGEKRKSFDFIASRVIFNGKGKSFSEDKPDVGKEDVSQADLDNFSKSYRPKKNFRR